MLTTYWSASIELLLVLIGVTLGGLPSILPVLGLTVRPHPFATAVPILGHLCT
jgi:hypothetical protein